MRRSRLAGLGLIGLGLGAAVGSLLGPLGFNIIRLRVSADMEYQFLGGDAVTLGLVAPVSIAAGVLWLRGHRLAPVLALGPTLYGLYTFLSMIFFPEYERYAGNNEKAFPLYLGLTILSWVIAAKAWSMIDSTGLPSLSTRLRRGLAATLLVLGGFLALAWSRQIGLVMSGDRSLVEYQEHPAGFWVIKTFDLAFVVPIALATGIGLLRNRALARKAAYGLAGFLTLMSAAVSGMGIVMLVRDDPSATVVLPAVTTPMTLVLAGLTIGLYRAYLAGPRADAGRGPLAPVRLVSLPEPGRRGGKRGIGGA